LNLLLCTNFCLLGNLAPFLLRLFHFDDTPLRRLPGSLGDLRGLLLQLNGLLVPLDFLLLGLGDDLLALL
jgi:hypothetical protein